MTRFARNQCHRHALRRIVERELDLGIEDILEIENTIRKCRGIIVRPLESRYRLGIHHRCASYAVVYDSDVDALVSIWEGITRCSFDREEIDL